MTKSLLVLSTILGQSNPPDLDSVLADVDRQFPKLLAANRTIEIARAKIQEKRGAFDPLLVVDAATQRYNSSSSRGKALTGEMLETSIEQQTRSGTKLLAGYRLNFGSVKSPASSSGDIGEYYFGLKVPLQRGNQINEKSIAEQVAELESQQVREEVLALRNGVRLTVADAFWQYVAAIQRRAISEQLLKIAVVRAEQIRQRVDSGDLPRLDIVEAEGEVKRREGSFTKAVRETEKAQIKLSLYTTLTPADIKIAEVPSPKETWNLSATNAEQIAKEQRPELRSIRFEADVVERDLRLAQNDRRPNFDLVLTPGFDAGRGSVGMTYKAGVFYSIPLRQNAVDGRIEQSKQKLEKISLDRELLEREIGNEVRDAVSAVSRAFERAKQGEQELRLARELELGERLRFEAGDSTLFLLNQRERSTAEAAARLVDVYAEFQIAISQLQAAKGMI